MNTTGNGKVTTGFSVNPELTFSYDARADNSLEKGTLQGFCIGLAGAGANITLALKSLEVDARLFGFVGPSNSDSHILLQRALDTNRISHRLLQALDQTSMAVIPIDNSGIDSGKVRGVRGHIQKSLTGQILAQLAPVIIDKDEFVVTSGVLEDELPFAKVLLGKASQGYRLFGPKRNICGTEPFKQFLPNCDLLVLNAVEWQECQMTFSEVHALGPSLIIVTRDEEGCDYSLFGKTGHVNAQVVKGVPHYTTGAGDWFLGGFIKAMVARGLSVESLDRTHLEDCLNFAAKVAGLKVTKLGASFGPTLAEVMCA